MSNNIYSMDLSELEEFFKSLNQPKYRAKQVYEWIHVKNATTYEAMTNLPKNLREQLSSLLPLSESKIINKQTSADGSRKYIIQLADNNLVETVGIPSKFEDAENHPDNTEEEVSAKRLTICFSTQVGCEMGCIFCATGKEGFKRNLTEQEIIDQIILVQQDFKMKATNLVVMGQGEPFLNYENTLSALKRANTDQGILVGARRITVSTCGIIKGINKFAQEPEQFTLAISLHSAIQSKRDLLLPRLKNQTLQNLHKALSEYISERNRRVSFEYIMINGINDGEEDLLSLIEYCKDLLCHVNIINLNNTPGSELKPTSQDNINYWIKTLNSNGVFATQRKSKGADIAGACGQLKNTL